MWSKDYADDDEMNPEGEDADYLGQKHQVSFTFNEEGTNTCTYEAGYMSSIAYEPAQQQ